LKVRTTRVALVEPLERRVLLSAGALDLTFNMSGREITPFQGSGTTATGVAIDPTDGKIVVVGTDVLNPNGQISSIALARYNTDGSPDTTFGTNGQVSTGFNSELAKAYAVTVTSTGQILVAGSIAQGGNPASSDFLLARWNSDGSLDTTFGTNGSTITDFAGGQDVGRALAIFGSRIYVAGQASNSSGKHFGIAAYSLGGFPDPSFGNTGTVITTVQGNFEQATAIAIDPNTGNIVLAGRAGNSSGPFSFGLVRYNTNGTHDNTFGVHGKVTDAFGPNGAKAFAVAIKGGGGIIAAGQANTDSSGDADFALAKFSNTGTLAAGFGNGGQVLTDADNNPADIDQISAMALDGNGRIDVVGTSQSLSGTGKAKTYLARYASGGVLDSSFGTGGLANAAFGGANRSIDAIAIQNDGNILAAGWTDNSGGLGLAFEVARYLGDPARSAQPLNASIEASGASADLLAADDSSILD
jgi:uncharacterized delta-60 repeat protein